MIGKILFTALVIILILVLARSRKRLQGGPAAAGAEQQQDPAPRWPRYVAYGFLALVLGAGASFLYLDWREAHELLGLRVINSRTGKTVTYQVYRGEMRGRSFTTTDGLQVTLSDEERVEVERLE